MSWHLNDTHSKQQFGASVGTMKSVTDPHSPLLACEVQIEGALEDSEILAIPPDYLALFTQKHTP